MPCSTCGKTGHNTIRCTFKEFEMISDNIMDVRKRSVPIYSYQNISQMTIPNSYTGPALCAYCSVGFYRYNGQRNCPNCLHILHCGIVKQFGSAQIMYVIYH